MGAPLFLSGLFCCEHSSLIYFQLNSLIFCRLPNFILRNQRMILGFLKVNQIHHLKVQFTFSKFLRCHGQQHRTNRSLQLIVLQSLQLDSLNLTTMESQKEFLPGYFPVTTYQLCMIFHKNLQVSYLSAA